MNELFTVIFTINAFITPIIPFFNLKSDNSLIYFVNKYVIIGEKILVFYSVIPLFLKWMIGETQQPKHLILTKH